ncbi:MULTISPECIES: hypothetical protein [unclassified Sphingomonas]|uniref:hypothetical protein n=1 Tax=unclassified Sphingomonas TaxID=196159 RepID=UPI0022697FBE|nr:MULTISPECIES: hypothetical protein [unclassified Sphingomonas]
MHDHAGGNAHDHSEPGNHDHGHAHGEHGHSHAPKSFGKAFAIGTALISASSSSRPVTASHPGDAYTAGVAADLKEKFGIDHATIQIETDPGTPCALESDKTV